MTSERLAVFFDETVLSVRGPDGLFDQPPSPLLDHQLPFVESPERIANIRSILARGPLSGYIDWHSGRKATDGEILLFHKEAYLATLKTWDAEGAWATSTTYLPKGGLGAVQAAAGTAIEAVRHVLDGKARHSYALVRPPGHHAAPEVADGYCFVNAAGVAALDALSRGCRRVAIVDWDVHHGNGTQEGFYERDDVLTISIHMDHGPWGPSHPQTGGVEEEGRGAGRGYNINLPLPMGCGDDTYVQLMRACVIPALERYRPDLILIANGQDAGQFDPNGRQLVTMRGFHHLAELIREAADRLCGGRLVAIQEGGYNPAHTAFCAYAIAAGMIGRPLELKDPLAFYPDDGPRAETTVASLVKRHPLARQWFADAGQGPGVMTSLPISIRSLTKAHGALTVLDGVDLDVRSGEFMTRLGPSGSGKTTLLMVIAGFVRPSAGQVLVADQDITRLPPHRRDLGMVFQNYALFPHMTVGENVAYPLRRRRHSKAEIETKVKAALKVRGRTVVEIG